MKTLNLVRLCLVLWHFRESLWKVPFIVRCTERQTHGVGPQRTYAVWEVISRHERRADKRSVNDWSGELYLWSVWAGFIWRVIGGQSMEGKKQEGWTQRRLYSRPGDIFIGNNTKAGWISPDGFESQV